MIASTQLPEPIGTVDLLTTTTNFSPRFSAMDSAAMRELFVDQETVFLVEGNSTEKIAEDILMLYKEDKLLHQVAKNGHLFFKQRFSREVLELQLEKYIAQVGL